jgi:hypothetical protein
VRPLLYVGGDRRHGVVRLSREIAGAVADAVAVAVADLSDRSPSVERFPPEGAVHLHFTDRLFGDSPDAAARTIAGLATRLAVTLTLHDVPQPSDGADRLPGRVAAYRAVIGSSAGVVCNSHHEVALLHETGALEPDAPLPRVIPLPLTGARPAAGGISSAAPEPRSPRHAPEVALLGFIYPGKGHAEAIDAVAAVADGPGGRPSVCALGEPSPGHARDLGMIDELARRRGVAFTATGWLTDAALARRARAAAVPLAAHTHLSASASINVWIGLGRRPLVADSRYAREIDALRPGTITIYEPAALPAAIATALAEPARTWLAPGTDTRPHLTDVARLYLDWWEER